MKAWNASSWPEYKSSLGWGSQKQAAVPKEGAAALRKPYVKGRALLIQADKSQIFEVRFFSAVIIISCSMS